MIVNKQIKDALVSISENSIKHSNIPDVNTRHNKRLIHFFIHNLTEEEQLYIFSCILEQIQYRSIITDPDNVALIHNIKLKTITYIFILSVILIIILSMIFNIHNDLKEFSLIFEHTLRILTL